MPYPVFKETQRFNQLWLWIVLLATSVLIIFMSMRSIYTQLILGEPFGTNPAPTSALLINGIVSLVFGIGFPFLFYYTKLETIVNQEGIFVIFSPFIRKKKQFKWHEIKEAKVCKYRPILDYGGWGVRHGFKGKAYNTSGNMGLQLFFTNGKRLLIGTQKPSELEAFLKKLEENQKSRSQFN